eukprot:6551900-Heterocapsa_arctica.AAC.1
MAGQVLLWALRGMSWGCRGLSSVCWGSWGSWGSEGSDRNGKAMAVTWLPPALFMEMSISASWMPS